MGCQDLADFVDSSIWGNKSVKRQYRRRDWEIKSEVEDTTSTIGDDLISPPTGMRLPQRLYQRVLRATSPRIHLF